MKKLKYLSVAILIIALKIGNSYENEINFVDVASC